MKSMKKLIPAICMLLIAASLLGSSTYAWFSMNTTVTATGMEVKATTSNNLVIANSAGSPFGVSANATTTGLYELTPASTSLSEGALSNGKFFYTTNNNTIIYNTGAAQDATKFAEVTNLQADVLQNPGPNYVAAHTFKIKVDGATDQKFNNVFVSALNVTDNNAPADAAISKALRVAVVSGSHAYIFAPCAETAPTYKGVFKAGDGITAGTTISNTAEQITSVGESATIGEVGTNEVTVTVYIWYEGQDENCTSANSVTVENLKVEIKFTGKN